MQNANTATATTAIDNREAPLTQQGYRGRFAPSPTGPLHFGSLMTAVGSYLQARASGGQWLVRIEDLDPPREEPGASEAILRTLERFGLEWDGPVEYQSRRTEIYLEALSELDAEGLIYRCTCSRRELRARLGHKTGSELVYTGICRERPSNPAADSDALRIRTGSEAITFTDRAQGRVTQNIEKEVGDYVVRRRDGQIAYQLAVVVDDEYQGITEVVRGCDLLDNTPRQIYLQRQLGYSVPSYLHVPKAVNSAGEKLSKQTGARPVEDSDPGAILFGVLARLGQSPPTTLAGADLPELWAWACANWRPERLTGIQVLSVEQSRTSLDFALQQK